MANSIEFAKNYTGILDEVYQRAAVSRCLNSGGRMVRAGRNAKEILIPKISVTGLGDYTRNVGYRDGSITMTYETKSPNYDRGLRLLADVMDVEEGGILDAFVAAGAELQRTQVAPEADAFTFSQVAGFEGVVAPALLQCTPIPLSHLSYLSPRAVSRSQPGCQDHLQGSSNHSPTVDILSQRLANEGPKWAVPKEKGQGFEPLTWGFW